jgi:multiple sugar transport system permease protein
MTRAEKWMLYLFLAPSLLMLLTFTIAPALWATYVSFTDLALTGPKAMNFNFVGLQQYGRLFRDPDFFHSVGLTFGFAAGTIVGQFSLGLMAALLLSRRRLRGQNLLLADIVLPMVIPAIVQALMWSSMLATKEFGTLNRVIGLLGFEPINWLREVPMLAITLVKLWNGTGFAMILFLAGLENIPHDLLEAASIDGADSYQMLRYIKIPLIRYVILLWLLLATLGSLNTFDIVYALTRGGPGNATEIMGIYTYNRGFKYFELGLGSAAAMIMLCISTALSLIYVRLLRVKL